jgi:hypothetical protein
MTGMIDASFCLPPMYFLPGGCLPELPPIACPLPSEGEPVKGDLSSKSSGALTNMINGWTGSAEDLILMVMIAVSKDMDEQIRLKAKEVLGLRQKKDAAPKDGDESTEALDQATQELQQMTKQRDQFFQMFQKILDSLTSSTDRLLASWK